MRVGILETGRPRESLREAFGCYPDMIRDLLAFRRDITFTTYSVVQSEWPDGCRACEAWIVTGSRHSVLDDSPWIRRLEGFLVEAHREAIALVGICFGHQVLAKALGGQVERAATGWCLGTDHYQLLAPRGWMSPARSDVNINVVHQDQVTTLPPGATLLASSSRCPNAMIDFGGNALGVQGHPEFSRRYLEQVIGVLAEDGVDIGAAMRDAGADHDAAIIASWIVRYLDAAQVNESLSFADRRDSR